jgi:hypothetical protein
LSTDGLPGVRWSVGIALGVIALAHPAKAAAVDFRPELTFGLFHSGNVEIIGNEPVGDDTAAISLDLAVDRTTAISDFSFYYQATYVDYRQNSALSYVGNFLGASYTKETSRNTGLQASVDVSRTDAQGIAAASIAPQGTEGSNVDRPQTFVPRTTITRGHGVVAGSVGAGQRSLVDWAFRAAVNRFDEVTGVSFNNSTSADASGGWRYELSKRTTLGLTVGINWFGFEGTANSFGQSIALTGTHALSAFTTMTFDLGVTRTTTADLSSMNGRFLLEFMRKLTANSSLTTAVQQNVTPGTGLQAATNDTGAWIAYTQSSVRNGLSWAIDGAYWLRKTLPAAGASTTETGTLNLSGALGWRFNRFLELRAGYANFYQNDRSDSSSQLNTSYSSYGLFLRWAIRGLSDSLPVGSRLQP